MSIRKIIFVCLLAVAGCKEVGTSAPAASSSATNATLEADSGSAAVVELAYDAVVRHAALSLRLLGVNDSRCPTGVNCRAAGRMLATIEVWQGDGAPMQVELKHSLKVEPAAVLAYEHEFRLVSIAPAPIYGAKLRREDYRVTIEVRLP